MMMAFRGGAKRKGKKTRLQSENSKGTKKNTRVVWGVRTEKVIVAKGMIC